MNLVIVESPTKARTIGRFLGEDYVIKASMGHIMDLPKSKLGVDVDHNFKPQYELVADKEKIFEDIKKAAKSAKEIILATDLDREGEAIASHVRDVLSSNSKFPGLAKRSGAGKIQNSKFQRIVFHEITKEAIEEALEHPRSIDKNLVEAQTARRVLDRLVGYKLSPLLWRKVRRGLSAGRVQSVALRLIVEREREIEKFKKEEYFTITAILSKERLSRQSHVVNESERNVRLTHAARDARQSYQQNQPQTRLLSESRHQTKENLKGKSESTFSSLAGDQAPIATRESTEFELIEISGEKIESQKVFNLYDGEYKVTDTTIKTQEKANKIVKDLGEKEFIVSDVIQKETYRSPQPPYTTSTLQQDGAHRLGFSGKRTMSLAQKLYEEGFITYHRTDSYTIAKSAQNSIINFVKNEYGQKYVPEKPRFYAKKQKLAQEAHEAIRPTKVASDPSAVGKELGRDYLKLYELIWKRAVASQMSDAVIDSTSVIVDTNDKKYRLKANGSVLVFEGFLKINPQALDDKKLPEFKALDRLDALSINAEKHETPPPPRYNDASLIKTLEEKGIGRPSTYAPIISTIEERRYIERTESRFTPTFVGIAVNDFLVKNFSDIDDIPFTAEMEEKLDNITNGENDWVPMIKNFYVPFSKKLKEVEDAKRVKIEVEKTDQKCEKCRAPMVIRLGRFGKFLSCSKFPDCKFSKPFIEETGITCPKCKGKVIVRKTRRGRKFFGCSNWPKCDFATWTLQQVQDKTLQQVQGKKLEDIKKATI